MDDDEYRIREEGAENRPRAKVEEHTVGIGMMDPQSAARLLGILMLDPRHRKLAIFEEAVDTIMPHVLDIAEEAHTMARLFPEIKDDPELGEKVAPAMRCLEKIAKAVEELADEVKSIKRGKE